MKEIDRLNEINGQPVFGINKFADQTKEGIFIFFYSIYLLSLFFIILRNQCPKWFQNPCYKYS